MTYVPITYIPDGPVTAALKRHIKGRDPKPQLGNLGPLLDENLTAARKHGYFKYHPDDLRLLKHVDQNPDIVDEGFDVLRQMLDTKDIAEPTRFEREAPYYPDVSTTLKYTALLAALMTVGITIAVVLGQDDAIAAMVVAIVAISLIGAALFGLILTKCVIRVGESAQG